MKKLIAMLMFVCLLPLCALAETVEVPLADGALIFASLPDGLCLAQDTSASVFNRAGFSQREMLPWMKENNVCAVMFDAAWGCEVQMEVMEASQPDYNTITPEQDASMLADFVAFNERYGMDVEQYGMYDNGHHRFGWVMGTETLDTGETYYRIQYKTSHRDYLIEMTMFVYETALLEHYAAMARTLVDSMQYAPHPELARLTQGAASIQCVAPDGVNICPDAATAGVDLPEVPFGDVVGCAAGDGWFLLWQLDDRVSGDLDKVTDAAVKSLYQSRAKNKKSAGCTVTLTEDHAYSRQRYIRIGYQVCDENGDIWYAEEYYTKQAGWGASVTLYSAAPLTEDMQAMLEAVVNSQMVTVDE